MLEFGISDFSRTAMMINKGRSRVGITVGGATELRRRCRSATRIFVPGLPQTNSRGFRWTSATFFELVT